jgi:hypothetical protein
MFWFHLAEANLNGFGPAFDPTAVTDDTQAVAAAANIGDYIPEANIGTGNRIHAFSEAGINYWVVGGMGAMGAAGLPEVENTLSPSQAFGLDNKVDDGRPHTGVAVALDASGAAGAAPIGLLLQNGSLSAASDAAAGFDDDSFGACAVGATRQSLYNTNETNPGESDAPACVLRFRMN